MRLDAFSMRFFVKIEELKADDLGQEFNADDRLRAW
jgi:hypothetical protein